MNKTKIEVKTSSIDIIKSKFIGSLSTIEGYLKEAEGDVAIGQTYSASAVNRRIVEIKNSLIRDLNNLSKEISISEE
jgi:hypothetical protein